jgi:hypoxanthine phosphoribosyltransferase
MEILYSKDQLETIIKNIASQIDKEHSPSDPPVMVCVLNGAFMFFSDLVKNLTIDCKVDFIRAHSYQGKTQSELKITKSIDTCIFNKTVYLVDDILDSGVTINKLTEHLQLLNPKKVVPVTLFKKVSTPTNGIYGIDLPEGVWIYGYGLDDENGYKRNLPNIFGE